MVVIQDTLTLLILVFLKLHVCRGLLNDFNWVSKLWDKSASTDNVSRTIAREDGDPELAKYIQPNDISSGKYDNITTEEAEKIGLCTRPCDNANPMLCYYHFTLESYATVGPACGDCLKNNQQECKRKGCIPADGFERPILSINRQLPGPSIQVCKGDTIVVDVHNMMLDRETAIHWHGLYQRETPFMDGVPMVTQCPIYSGTTFRYKFPALPAGSMFYHSHEGLQKMDGLEGSMIIREPKKSESSSSLYDFDLPSHVVMVGDWLHTLADGKFPGTTYNGTRITADALLINGRTQTIAESQNKGYRVPMSYFKVQKDKKYRFRIIGGSCLACPLLFTVEKHQMLVIAADGTSVEPQVFDSLTLFPGDRMDVVIHANQNPALYWIQAKSQCDQRVTSEAVLQYEGEKLMFNSGRPKGDTFPRGKSLNAIDADPSCKDTRTNICWARMNSLNPPAEPSVLKAQPDIKLVLALDEYFFTPEHLFWKDNDSYNRFFQSSPVLLTHLINNKSFVIPPFPPLTQNDTIPAKIMCPQDENVCSSEANKNGKLCECVNIVYVKLGQVAEIILVDWGDSTYLHPMHLHGTDIYIMEQGVIPKDADNRAFVQQLQERLVKEGPNLASTRPKPVIKDTVTIPPSGYAVVRVYFNNPGVWICHCHYIFHSHTGMAMLFWVGDKSQFKTPPPDFPKCNNFLPKVDPNEFKNIDWDDEPAAE